MFTSNPKIIALTDALALSMVTGALYLLVNFLTGFSGYQGLLILLPAVFIISYFVIKYSIDKFIFDKIRIIYQTIGKLKTKPEIQAKQKKGDDVLDIVNQAVLEWSAEQQEEIAELKRSAGYRREFLGNVSHELKTPIFNIQGYILTLLDGGLEDDEINVKFLKKARKSVNRLIAIVEDLEDITRFESGNLQLKMEEFDIDELIRDVADYMELKASENNAEIVVKAQAGSAHNVIEDKKRIRQVLINLIDNAIKYGDAENGRVEISVYDFHDFYLVEISDNGIGIPEEYLFRVFERFFRTDRARSRQKGGSGLGLAIVKHIIEAHNQKISVRNNPGKGSTFSFSVQKV